MNSYSTMGKASRRHRARNALPIPQVNIDIQGQLPAPVPAPAPPVLKVKNFDFGDTQLPPEYDRIINCQINNITAIKPSTAVLKMISLGGKNQFEPPDASNEEIITNYDTFARSTRLTELYTDEIERTDNRFHITNTSYAPPKASLEVETWLSNFQVFQSSLNLGKHHGTIL
jgi:hypothetical protein